MAALVITTVHNKVWQSLNYFLPDLLRISGSTLPNSGAEYQSLEIVRNQYTDKITDSFRHYCSIVDFFNRFFIT